MSKWLQYLKSSIGRKKIVGLTGLGLCGFVLMHMSANLLLFAGAEPYNKYSHALISNPLIYVAEAGLVALFIIHLYLALQLAAENRRARKQGYQVPLTGDQSTPIVARVTVHTGVVILVFVVFHLITFKYGPNYTVTYDGKEIRDLYRLVVEVFQQPAYVVWYLFSMFVLWFHLSHGFASSWQSLGINRPIKRQTWLKLGYLFGTVVAGGFFLQPLFIFLTGGR